MNQFLSFDLPPVEIKNKAKNAKSGYKSVIAIFMTILISVFILVSQLSGNNHIKTNSTENIVNENNTGISTLVISSIPLILVLKDKLRDKKD